MATATRKAVRVRTITPEFRAAVLANPFVNPALTRMVQNGVVVVRNSITFEEAEVLMRARKTSRFAKV